tara:strand:+ start:4773 stop:5114 length:342 start_codon:yes stop_codon:yes gene_type:complete
MKRILIVLVIILQSSFVYAHSPVKSIIPKNGIVLNKAPTEIKVNFKSSAKLLKTTLQKVEGSDVALSKEPLMKNAKNHSIPLPSLEPGTYHFKWRAMSEDGHIIKGKSKFKLQ